MNGHNKVLSIHTSFDASALSKLKNDISHVSRAANKVVSIAQPFLKSL